MGARVDHDIVRSYLIELRPHLSHIDAGMREMGRITPDALAVSQAIQSLVLVRGSSYVLALNDIVTVASALREAVGNVQDYSAARRVESHEHLLHLSNALRQAADRAGIESAPLTGDRIRLVGSGGDADLADEPEHLDDMLAAADVSQADVEATDSDEDSTEQADASITNAFEVDDDVREIFYEEARELFEALTVSVTALTQQPDNRNELYELRRNAHTLKGASNMTGFPLVGRVGGALEGLLDVYLERELALDRSTLEVVLIARRFLAAMLISLDDLDEFERPVTAIETRCAQLRDAHEPLGGSDTDAADHTRDLIATPVIGESIQVDADVQSDAHAVTSQSDATRSSPDAADPDDMFDDGSMLVAVGDDRAWTDRHEPTVEEAFEDVEIESSDVNIYELASEIANMARVQSNLRPHNAAIMPDDLDSLTDSINALTAEVEPPGTEELVAAAAYAEPVVEATEANGVVGELSEEFSETLVPLPEVERLTSLFGTGQSELGSALLDLALGGALATFAPAPKADAAPVIVDSPLDGPVMEREIRDTFRSEARDLIDALTRAAMAMEHDPRAHEPLREAYRILHTLKGAAGVAGFDAISQGCHALEESLAGHEDNGASSAACVANVFGLIQAVEHELRATRAADRLAGSEPATDAIAASVTDVRVEIGRLDGLLDLVGELVVNRSTFDQRLQRFGAAIAELALTAERLRRSSQVLEQDGFDARTLRLLGPLPESKNDAASSARNAEFDALELDRYTEIDRLARELAEVASDIGAATGELHVLRSDFDTVSTRQQRLTTAMQDDLMRVRMVPARSLAPRLYRIVRGVARERGKDVDFALEGGATPFDTSLLEALSDSLAHLLRNAVDHGIEPPEERSQAGKPARGHVLVRAYRDGNEAVIEVSDDGRGIDHEQVIARAVALGYPVSAEPSRADAMELILLPGFSTRETADELSGRGVGLDVVQGAVERLKGRVSIDSRLGVGTTFRLRLPVMLAVSQAFLVTAGGQRFAIPVGNVELVAQRRGARIRRFGDAAVIEINDATLPAFDLGERLTGLDAGALDLDDGWLLIVRAGEERWAVRVEGLEGQQEIVVKPLGRFLKQTRGVIGATILGTGDVALIVDIPRIATTGTAAAMRQDDAAVDVPAIPDAEPTRARVALIVDDSLSVRKVLGRTLARHGWTTLDARDGVEALELLDFNVVDVVVTDIEMPRMDGFELTTAARRHRDHQAIPIVVLTSRSSDKHRGKALDLGANAYLVKPFQEQELIATLESVVRQGARISA